MQNSSSPALVSTVARILFLVVVGTIALVLAHSGHQATAHAATPVQAVCSTDLDCAAYELGQAAQSGATIYEDLSFDGASELYSAKNDLLADAFWAAHAGEDWDTAKYWLDEWVTAYRLAPAGQDCP
jgi:hypothetical protein